MGSCSKYCWSSGDVTDVLMGHDGDGPALRRVVAAVDGDAGEVVVQVVVVDRARDVAGPHVAQLADGSGDVVLQVGLEPPLELDALLLLLVLLVLVRAPRPRGAAPGDAAAARAADVGVLRRRREDVAHLVVELDVEALARLRRRRASERDVDLGTVVGEEHGRLPGQALLAVLLVHVLLEARHLTRAHVRRRVLVRLAGAAPLEGLGLHLLQSRHEVLDELVVALGVVVRRLRLVALEVQVIVVGHAPGHGDGAAARALSAAGLYLGTIAAPLRRFGWMPWASSACCKPARRLYDQR